MPRQRAVPFTTIGLGVGAGVVAGVTAGLPHAAKATPTTKDKGGHGDSTDPARRHRRRVWQPAVTAPARREAHTIRSCATEFALPNFTDLATPDAIDAAAAVAERLGWDAAWTTDHVLVDRGDAAADYRTNYDAIETLAWVGARHPTLRLGTSVIVVPQRNAVVLAKELATLDALSGGRVIAGVGVGWNRREFGNLGAADRFDERGTYLSETIRALAPPLVRLDRTVRGPLPPARRLRLRTAAAAGRRAADLDRRAVRARPQAGRAGSPTATTRRRRQPGCLRRAAAGHPGRRRRRRPADAGALGPGPGRVRRRDRHATTRCAARPRRSPPRSAPSPRSASRTLALWFIAPSTAPLVEAAERFAAEVAPLV